jgi:hypothetical protein
MALTTPHDERSSSVHLHRWVFRGIIGFVLLMILAAWGFTATWSPDANESYTGLVLAMMSYFCLVAVGIAYALGRITRNSPDPAREDDMPTTESLQRWASREIEVSDGHQRGSHVMIDILLPPAAVAIGMVALVIVWHLAPAAR